MLHHRNPGRGEDAAYLAMGSAALGSVVALLASPSALSVLVGAALGGLPGAFLSLAFNRRNTRRANASSL
jgi:hypothetical protein